jgi:hypothetical protein
MAKGKKNIVTAPEEVIEPVIEETVITEPETQTPVEEEIIPEEAPVITEEPKPVVKETTPKAEAKCQMIALPGGKYQVIYMGVKDLGKWGKEKAEYICNQYNN